MALVYSSSADQGIYCSPVTIYLKMDRACIAINPPSGNLYFNPQLDQVWMVVARGSCVRPGGDDNNADVGYGVGGNDDE